MYVDAGRAARLAAMSAQALRTFQKNQRLVGRFESQLLGVIGVVESEGENCPGSTGGSQTTCIFGDDAAIGKAQAAVIVQR